MVPINYDDFKKVELKTAKIVEAERVEGSDKLIRLKLDLGPSNLPAGRQVVAGIGLKYQPEDLVGKTIVVVANLEPRTFTLRSDSPQQDSGQAGKVSLESQGMLLAASGGDEGPILLTTMEEISPGSEVR
ncbi:MAG: methionyl-tRNA synthetase, methionyl-tRNA synthetase [Candidatus Wolfebacteria bacterium GW2011_GWC1_43_10]|uniref:Methionyl-tRNA synthetase, methionyl-tRNA synthetase n=1 Tax=Candidatus Wolfebacteria bacterium GW2011_GWC1_43_10 TaxID=1619011 RepID=A0A0G1CBQ4_9BACT|nr:MAG: methionyl-tRNA synthetase, methionyl-tRNA synthetase [Candidatus Wolfebacteria bacterium GW2011_GWC1_43_10]KKT23049.1 MAG: hypothetical protein UW08_C0001G0012 [Parcubacteria group bacterium GW2011_GWB1_43_8b]